YAPDRQGAKAINEVARNVKNLNESVRRLQLQPNGGTTVLELNPIERALGNIGNSLASPPNYSPALKEMLDRIGDPQPSDSDVSLFGKIRDFDGKISNFDSKFDRVVGTESNAFTAGTVLDGLIRLNNNIGEPDNTQDKKTVFENLQAATKQVDELSAKVGRPDESQDAKTLFGRIGSPEDSNSSETIFGRTNAVKNVADNIEEYSTDIWRKQAGRNGRNIVTRAKELVMSERYVVSIVAVREIEREMQRHFGMRESAAGESIRRTQRFLGESRRNTREREIRSAREILNRLSKLTSRPAMKRSQLAAELTESADEQTRRDYRQAWKKWRKMILKTTRVSRV
ncbi:MAG: hypothetical protein HKN25_09145, partial [Pyrinomonadaceae bacterium]|nr:hypothetical protein [Pyrinomonadaceae bacterium]